MTMTINGKSNGHPFGMAGGGQAPIGGPPPSPPVQPRPSGAGSHDAVLDRAVRRAAWMRQGFYVVVLIVAMAGQVTGAVEALHIPLIAAVPAVAALELGGIVVLANADVRRRLGERAIASRLLSVAIAAWAVAFNWLAHSNHLLGGFYAGMSALGYAVWLMHTENQRRDRLRAKGDLPQTTPAYELWSHWLRHPLLTMRAKSLAKRDPRLGLYGSIDAATAEVRRERRTAAIAKVLERKVRARTDPADADIALSVYEMDQIAVRVARMAQYDKLAALVAEGLAPERLGVGIDPPTDRVTTDRPPTPTDRPTAPLIVRSTVLPVGPPTDRPTARVKEAAPGAPTARSAPPVGEDRPGPTAPRVTDRPTGSPPPQVEITAPPVKTRPTARVDDPTDRPGGPDGHSTAARANAAELGRRWPDGLPSDWAIREATGWGSGRVTKARAAYEAGAHHNP